MKNEKFTSKQQKFIDLYEGNGTKAAREAGYTGDDNTLAVAAKKLLRNGKILAAIKEREIKTPQGQANAKRIASREDRQAFWTKILEDDNKDMKDRLKASELLGRSQADFTDRVEVSGDLYEKVAAARARVGKK